MAFALGPIATAAGYGLAEFETVGSTNDEAMARARAGDTGPLWLRATIQSGPVSPAARAADAAAAGGCGPVRPAISIRP